MSLRALPALLLLTLAALPAAAHRLVVYAQAAAGEIVVEANFDNGNPAQSGQVRLLDAGGALLAEAPLAAGGVTRLPLPDGAEAGLEVRVQTDAGHTDYWLLTPADLEAAR